MGGKHILEWTIRVNMFEAILHAVLHTLRAEGVWEGEVKAIAPSKVGPFWIGEEEAEDGDAEKEGGEKTAKTRASQSVKVRNKGLKIDLVRGWLEEGKMVRLGNDEVERMALAYKEKWDRVPGRQRKVKMLESEEVVVEMEKIPKLDDLADSLLQGIAWIQWEENKRIALNHGVEALLEPMG
jgi:cruciform cutting endonuclease 1